MGLGKIIGSDGKMRRGIITGALKAAEAVCRIYGPGGRAAVIGGQYGRPDVTRSGAALTKSLVFRPPEEEAGAAVIRALAADMEETLGDGASTAVVLAAAILSGGLRLVEAGADTEALRRGIAFAEREAGRIIHAQRRPVSGRGDIEAAAAVSAGDPELGRLAVDALESVNYRGAVSVRASATADSFVQHEAGMCFERGWFSPYMASDGVNMETRFENAAVFLCDRGIDSIDELLPLLNEASLSNTPLLIIAADLSQSVLTSMLGNISQKTIELCAAKAPGYAMGRRALLEDIAVFTGGIVFGTELESELRMAALAKCGHAARVRVTRDNTFIHGGAGDPNDLDRYVNSLRRRIACAPNIRVRDELKERAARLTDGTAVIRVGALSETEREERTERIRRALAAASAAAEGGILPGGGTAYLRAARKMESIFGAPDGDERLGARLLIDALSAPAACVAKNAGYPAGSVVSKTKAARGWRGFDAAAGKYCDLAFAGIVDAAPVVETALEKAAGAASQLLTAQAAVLEKPNPAPKEAVPDSVRVSPDDFL